MVCKCPGSIFRFDFLIATYKIFNHKNTMYNKCTVCLLMFEAPFSQQDQYMFHKTAIKKYELEENRDNLTNYCIYV